MTNYEKIKQMTVEELTDFIDQVTFCCEGANCEKCPLAEVGICTREYIKEWLESEAETE